MTEYSKEEIGPAAEVQMERRLLVLELVRNVILASGECGYRMSQIGYRRFGKVRNRSLWHIRLLWYFRNRSFWHTRLLWYCYLLTVAEREHSHGMLTYKYWPMTSFMYLFLHVIRKLLQQDSYVANQIAASVVSHSPHQVLFDHSLPSRPVIPTETDSLRLRKGRVARREKPYLSFRTT